MPTEFPTPGQHLKLIPAEIDLEAPLNGGLLVKQVALSLDPYMRSVLSSELSPALGAQLTSPTAAA